MAAARSLASISRVATVFVAVVMLVLVSVSERAEPVVEPAVASADAARDHHDPSQTGDDHFKGFLHCHGGLDCFQTASLQAAFPALARISPMLPAPTLPAAAVAQYRPLLEAPPPRS